jgi:polysaccharide biosynthesis protein PslH
LKKDIVFITSRFPYPLNKGDKLRAFHQIKSLSKSANIYLISISKNQLSKEDLRALTPYCRSVDNFVLSQTKSIISLFKGLFSNKAFSVSYFYHRSFQKLIDMKIKEINPDIIHCHLIRTAQYVNSSHIAIKTIDYMDCFSIGAFKELNNTKNVFKKLFLQIEYKRLIKSEQSSFKKFNKHFIISQPDKDALPVKDSSQVMVLQNGVDFKTFYPNELPKEYDLLFSGHMGYVPNIAAAKYAITKIFPILPTPRKLLIAGIGTTSKISNLKSDKIIIQEHFTHIREAFWKSKILLAPMNISIGLQNKILQAMAMKVPVICSQQANMSINAPVGTSILTAAEPQEYIEAINLLLDDDEYYQLIANQGYQFVKNNFDWDIINNQFAEILLDL